MSSGSHCGEVHPTPTMVHTNTLPTLCRAPSMLTNEASARFCQAQLQSHHHGSTVQMKHSHTGEPESPEFTLGSHACGDISPRLDTQLQQLETQQHDLLPCYQSGFTLRTLSAGITDNKTQRGENPLQVSFLKMQHMFTNKNTLRSDPYSSAPAHTESKNKG